MFSPLPCFAPRLQRLPLLLACLASPFLAAGFATLDASAQTQQSVQFDGVNDHITFGAAPSLGASTFTIEVRFKRTGTGVVTSTGSGANAANGLINVVPLLAKGRGEADGTNVDANYFLGFRTTDNVLVADYEDMTASNNNHAIAGTTVIQNNIWYHAAATYDGTTFKLYLNGNLEAQAATTAQPRFDSIQHASLGTAMNSTGTAAGFFAGLLDEARIWNVARTQTEIQNNLGLEVLAGTGLLGRWGLNEGSGTVAGNSVASGVNGTLVNGPVRSTDSTLPLSTATAVRFGGTNGYLTMGNASALQLSQFTLELWFRRDGAGIGADTGANGIPDAIPLVAKGRAEAEDPLRDINYLLGIKAATGVLCADFEEAAAGATPSGNHPVLGVTPIATGVWHHAAATYDGTSWKLYLDGQLENQLTVGQPAASASTVALSIASALNSTGVAAGFFDGAVDEVRIWSVARSQAQIQGSMTSEITPPTAGLVARWGLNEDSGTTVASTAGTTLNGTITGSNWAWAAGSSFTPPPAPADPSGLTATANGTTTIDLTWTDSASNETAYQVERSTSGSGGPFSLLTTLAANATGYSNTGLTPETEYCYRVRAMNLNVPSAYAGPACATTAPVPNMALDFTGTNAYASFGNPAAVHLSTFTLEMWIRRDGAGVGTDTGTNGIPDAIPLLARGRAESEAAAVDINYFFGIKAATGVLCADLEEGAGGAAPSGNHPVLGATPIGTGGWHHVAATYDGTTWKLYLDGNLDGQLAVGQPAASASDVAVAMASALNSTNVASGFFDGAIDEVRVWNVARTQAEIQGAINSAITTPTSGLVARWGMDEGTGTTVNGSAGTTVSGTITGTGFAWAAGAPFNVVFTPPAAPSELGADAPSNSQIDLSWSDNSGNETGFEIERSTTGIGGSYSLLTTRPANSTSYSDVGLSSATEYCYRIRAVNGTGASSYDGPACATTLSAPSLALDFSGSTYVMFGDPPALDLAQFTVECWFRRDGTGTIVSTGSNGVPNAIPLVTKGTSEVDGSNVDMNFFLGIDDATGHLMADFEEGAAGTSPGLNHPVLGTTAIVNGAWHHAAATYDGSTWNLYLDGILETTSAVGQPCQSQSIQPAALASSVRSNGTSAQGFFDGALDEVRIWSVARSQVEIQSQVNAQLATAQANLVARWALDEGSGTAVNGSAGTMVNGTITGANYAWTAGAPFNLAFNLPPGQPGLIVPPNNATEVSTGPSLYVSAADPEGGGLTVTWYGRPLTSGPPGPDFTLVGQPDTQYYTGELNGGTNAILQSINNWIVANRATRNITYVATLGDCVEHGDNSGSDIEWQRADVSYDLIENPSTTGLPEGIPYGITVGNHDQSPNGDANGTTTFYNQYFGTSRFQGRSYYGGHYGANNDNWYDLFSAGGMDFVVISFEYDTTPDQAVLDWGDQLLTTYSNRRAIVLSHNIIGTGNPGTFSTQGQAIYNALRGHSNLFLMLAGHVPGEGRRQDTFNGVTVNTLMSDYQGRTNGGNGWMRIMTFSPANNTIDVETYSPWLGQFETDADSKFTVTYAMSSTPPFQLLGSTSGVVSGTNAQFVWSGLTSATVYEWYATVNDGSVTTTGPTWRFTTSSTVGVDDPTITEIALAPITPNPAKNGTHLGFALPRATPIKLSVLDLQGREVAVLANGRFEAGRHSMEWDGRTRAGLLASGLYLVRLQTPDRTETKKLIWTR
jgi:hypothetical protein